VTSQCGGEKAVGAVEVRQQPEIFTRFKSDSLLHEQVLAVKGPKVAAVRQERGDDVLVLLGKQAAGGIDQPPAGFYRVRRRRRGLFRVAGYRSPRWLAPRCKCISRKSESEQAVTLFPSRSRIISARRLVYAACLIQAQLAPSKCRCCFPRGSRVRAREP